MGADTKEKVEKVERPDSIEKVDGLPEEVVEYIEELEKAQDTLLEENESLVEDNATLAEEVENLQDQLDLDGDDEEEVTKAELAKLDPGTRRIIEKSMDRAKKAEELAKNERDARETREFISKAADFNMISTPEDLGPLLHKLSKALPEADYTAVETLLRATNDQIKEGGLFSTIGKSGESGSGNGGNGSASDIVKSKAKQLIEKSSKEGYTMEQAMLDVVLENPGLYDQYNAELRQGVK